MRFQFTGRRLRPSFSPLLPTYSSPFPRRHEGDCCQLRRAPRTNPGPAISDGSVKVFPADLGISQPDRRIAERRIRRTKAPVFSKLRSLRPLARTLVRLSRGTSGTTPKLRISLEKRLTSWRRGWDSNPRYGYPYNGFRVLRFSCWRVPLSS
jgi:hypothetical protein